MPDKTIDELMFEARAMLYRYGNAWPNERPEEVIISILREDGEELTGELCLLGVFCCSKAVAPYLSDEHGWPSRTTPRTFFDSEEDGMEEKMKTQIERQAKAYRAFREYPDA